MQYVGLFFLFSLYIFQGLKFLIYDLPKDKKKDVEKKETLKQIEEQLIRES